MNRLLEGARRHPVLTVLGLALAARLLVGAVLVLWLNNLIFPDAYLWTMLADRATETPPAEWHNHYQRGLYAVNRAFLWPLTGLFGLFGTSLLLGGMYAALIGAVTAGVTTRLALEVVEAPWAILAGLIMAFLPSVVLWSSMPLKDGTVWLILVLLALCIAAGNRTTRWTLLAWYTGVAALLVGLAHVRRHTLVVAVIALALASLAGRNEWRWQRVGAAALLAVVVPWSVGMGPGGIDFVTDGRSAQQWRTGMARDAETALLDPDPPGAPAPGEGRQAPPGDDLTTEPARTPPRRGIVAELSYLPRGITVMLLYPPPWIARHNPNVRLALTEHVAWIPVLLLALIGLIGTRRRLDVLAFPILAGGGILVMYALASGNFGTAYRHRAEFVWVVALLACMGARRLRRGGALPSDPLGTPAATTDRD